MAIRVVYMTAGSMDEAVRIAEALVQKRLAACVNLFDGVRSFYEWDNALQDDREVVMIAKTRADRIADLVATVKSLHSYDCPCIVEMAAIGGNNDFLTWIAGQVDPSPAKDV